MKKVIAVAMMELLLVIFLSSLFISFVSRLLLTAKKSMEMTQARATVQYHGLVALSIITKASLLSGFLGCDNHQQVLKTAHINPQHALRILSNYSSGLPASVKRAMKPKTMVLEVRYMSAQPARVIAINSQGHQLQFKLDRTVNNGMRMIISNCTVAKEFIVKTVQQHGHSFTVVTQSNLSGFRGRAWVGLYEDDYFYIRQTNYHNKRQQKNYALYQKSLYYPAQEIVAGVDNMQLKGLPGPQPLLQLALLTDSIEAVTLKKRPYRFNGALHIAEDGKYYQAWYAWLRIAYAR